MIPLHSPQGALRPTAIALGSFDGLHSGHRRVIAAVAGATDAVPTVVSFWPHPRELLHGETRLRLDLPAEKLELLEPLGVRQLVLVPFDHGLAALSPGDFVSRVLVHQLQARRIAVGDNFRFGVNRSGDAQDLARIGAALGIHVDVLPMLWQDEERMSSSRIRRALAAGDVEAARLLLERPYRFSGRVVAGRGLGRQLGWPTANLEVDGRKFLPLEGVYAAWAWIEPLPGAPSPGEGLGMAAVMNLGPQPTIDPDAPSAVEVHLLDRRIDLDGATLRVEPIRLLRRQQAFPGLDALTAQIGADASTARQLCGCVGVGEPPGDEDPDPPEQQNP